MTKVINFYAGPGAGKSTNAAGVFYEMKRRGIECELVTEYAKDCVWEDRTNVLNNQLYVLAKQYHRLWKLQGKVDYIITDSPMLLSYLYSPPEDKEIVKQIVNHYYNKMDNFNIFVSRTKPYNPKGRMQVEDEAIALDVEISSVVNTFDKFHFIITSYSPIGNTVDEIIGVV